MQNMQNPEIFICKVRLSDIQSTPQNTKEKITLF